MILKFVYPAPEKEEHCFECCAYEKNYNPEVSQYAFKITLKSGVVKEYHLEPDAPVTVYVMSDEGKTIDMVKI